MANVKAELKGIDELRKRIEEMGRKGMAVENKALKTAGKIVEDEAKKTSAFKDKSGKLRQGISISGVRSRKGNKHILVGIQKGDNSHIFYGKFLEYGTSKMSAKPFMGPAFSSKKSEASEVLKSEIRKGLGL